MLDWLHGPGSPVRRWRQALDLWCSIWFWPDANPPPAKALPDLTDFVLTGRSTLPAAIRDPWLACARRIAATHGFLHWPLEFPDAFFDSDGRPLRDPGFDAVLGNPPWNMIRADSGSAAERETSRDFARRLVRFCRDSGVYSGRTHGHANAYQLFLDRSLSLVKRKGRLGMVLPGGLLTDHGSASLRRRLLGEHDVDAIVGFENRAAVFPIHRSMRFIIVTATAGRADHGVLMPIPYARPERPRRHPRTGRRIRSRLAADPAHASTPRAPLRCPDGDSGVRVARRCRPFRTHPYQVPASLLEGRLGRTIRARAQRHPGPLGIRRARRRDASARGQAHRTIPSGPAVGSLGDPGPAPRSVWSGPLPHRAPGSRTATSPPPPIA